MTFGSPDLGKFEFVKLAALRTAQLMRGCTPRVAAVGKPTTTAQREVATVGQLLQDADGDAAARIRLQCRRLTP